MHGLFFSLHPHLVLIRQGRELREDVGRQRGLQALRRAERLGLGLRHGDPRCGCWNGHGAGEIGSGASGASGASWFDSSLIHIWSYLIIFPWCFLNYVLKIDESILIILKYLQIAPDASIDGAMEKQCQTAVNRSCSHSIRLGCELSSQEWQSVRTACSLGWWEMKCHDLTAAWLASIATIWAMCPMTADVMVGSSFSCGEEEVTISYIVYKIIYNL